MESVTTIAMFQNNTEYPLKRENPFPWFCLFVYLCVEDPVYKIKQKNIPNYFENHFLLPLEPATVQLLTWF